ncbi:MAG: hypothetical protein A2Y64_00340 [Candidatus Coatesbacteria bacterium RBG_13_66_14]|uniref:Outer membrane protein beta-barrel domain-containing protein n=1 Tax=Candidatus Coatesbacteria bacterium RBG_13_66_14 TaxID=1817816 RepID=A0A1F5EVH4_9BACT|nr:MAG: hypothetical protein A2Y64_00340 [Candidatus Coatesbacteria bacterium RBG_13_66_14]
MTALLAIALCAPLWAEEEEQILGFVIGLGAGLLVPNTRDVPDGLDDAGLLLRLDLGLTVAKIVGVKAVLGFSSFEWPVSEDKTVPMSHQLFTLDLFTEVDLGEKWRLWPAVGYTLDASITDTNGTGFLTAHGIHAELGCGYRLNSIMFVNLAVGYHFTDEFQTIDIDEDEGVEWGDAPGVSYLDIHAGVVFSLK